MPAINSETAEAWRQIAADTSAQRPSYGKRVTVTKGKHKGKSGVVMQHKVSRYGSAYRYGSDASHCTLDMIGRDGWCVQIQLDGDRYDRFWTGADNVRCEP